MTWGGKLRNWWYGYSKTEVSDEHYSIQVRRGAKDSEMVRFLAGFSRHPIVSALIAGIILLVLSQVLG